ncbi:hypothetical protein K440DRAFT_639304 [Wilcoxina mikolae CBS 423.85]|nr:hypothetical protein K440DRAFT_639304 [Wilcoxina mikolae CBS 423.85]
MSTTTTTTTTTTNEYPSPLKQAHQSWLLDWKRQRFLAERYEKRRLRDQARLHKGLAQVRDREAAEELRALQEEQREYERLVGLKGLVRKREEEQKRRVTEEMRRVRERGKEVQQRKEMEKANIWEIKQMQQKQNVSPKKEKAKIRPFKKVVKPEDERKATILKWVMLGAFAVAVVTSLGSIPVV